MKVYRIELMVIDHDEIGEDEVVQVLENARYPNHCIYPVCMSRESRDIGEWSDDHPLNNRHTRGAAYRGLFPQTNDRAGDENGT